MFALVAQAAPLVSPETVWTGIVVISLGVVVAIVDKTTAIIDRYRAKPPAHDVFQTKEEADRLETRMRTEISALDTRSEKRTKENRDLVQDKVTDLERVLSDKISENRNSNSKEFGEMKGEFSGLRSAFQVMSNDLFHAIGKLQGQVDNGTIRGKRST